MSHYGELYLRNIRMKFEDKVCKLAMQLVDAPDFLDFEEMTDIAMAMEQMTETVDDLLAQVAAAEATRR